MTQSRSDLAVVDAEIGQVRSLDIDALRREWRRMYHSEPPQLSRDLLALALAYKIQELQHGALGKSTRRKLQTMAKSLRATGRIASGLSISLKPGARLVREWRGRAHTVTVTEEGFEYGGGDYPSLTKIAEKITGTKWSGPRFFGLLAPNGKRQNIGANNR